MYQQMMESAKALDKLHQQNEAYVNGTTTTMDGMESKVRICTLQISWNIRNMYYRKNTRKKQLFSSFKFEKYNAQFLKIFQWS